MNNKIVPNTLSVIAPCHPWLNHLTPEVVGGTPLPTGGRGVVDYEIHRMNLNQMLVMETQPCGPPSQTHNGLRKRATEMGNGGT